MLASFTPEGSKVMWLLFLPSSGQYYSNIYTRFIRDIYKYFEEVVMPLIHFMSVVYSTCWGWVHRSKMIHHSEGWNIPRKLLPPASQSEGFRLPSKWCSTSVYWLNSYELSKKQWVLSPLLISSVTAVKSQRRGGWKRPWRQPSPDYDLTAPCQLYHGTNSNPAFSWTPPGTVTPPPPWAAHCNAQSPLLWRTSS